MNKITAVIITHNESRNIQRCLRSLHGVADEIIVVDDFSSDDTVQLCRQEGAIVQQQSWLGFGPQKNLGIGMAAHDYILSLDADEALDEELKASIVAAKQKGLQGLYEFTRSNFYYGKFLRHGFEYPDFKIRLFPKMGVRWNDDKVHENLIVDNTLTTSRLKGHLLHYTYLFIHEHVSKANKYTSLAADNYKASGKKTSWFKIIFSPLFTFIQAFLFKRGFLDGKHGFVLAILHAHGTFLKYIKLWELNKNKSGNEK